MRWRESQINSRGLAAAVTSLAAVFLVLIALITPPQVYDQFVGKSVAGASLQNSVLDDDFDEKPKPDGGSALVPSFVIRFFESGLSAGNAEFAALAANTIIFKHFSTGPPVTLI